MAAQLSTERNTGLSCALRDNIALLDVKGALLRSFPIPAPLRQTRHQLL